jgi:hypothetical protein
MNTVVQAAENFIRHDETIAGVEAYGHGIIHDTYLVKPGNGADRFILQRINTQVFTNPAAVMHNLRLVCAHMQERRKAGGSAIDANWQMLQSIPEKISCLHDAREAGRALGIFHWLISDLNPELLHVTLPGFHNIEHYLKQYDEVIVRSNKSGEDGSFCQQFVEDRKRWAPVLENGRRENLLRVRVIHGDPKINNILVNRNTGEAVSIIDLDTVMPGLVLYDIGDCLRSCCNTAGEEVADFSAVRFDLERCGALLSGYTGAAREVLTGRDFDLLFDAVRLMPFELGLRFYTDFLAGNEYFKISRRGQNLERAMVQFKLVESIERQEEGGACHGAV